MKLLLTVGGGRLHRVPLSEVVSPLLLLLFQTPLTVLVAADVSPPEQQRPLPDLITSLGTGNLASDVAGRRVVAVMKLGELILGRNGSRRRTPPSIVALTTEGDDIDAEFVEGEMFRQGELEVAEKRPFGGALDIVAGREGQFELSFDGGVAGCSGGELSTVRVR